MQVVWTDEFSTLLTFDINRIIDDDRIGIDRPYNKDWNLIIHDVRVKDRGRYICQINTHPIKTKPVELNVLGNDCLTLMLATFFMKCFAMHTKFHFVLHS